MDYNHIKNFLDKFKILISSKEDLKNIVTKTISEEISHQINKESIKLKSGIVFIQTSPILKSEILIHKKQILFKLKNLLPDNNFYDLK